MIFVALVHISDFVISMTKTFNKYLSVSEVKGHLKLLSFLKNVGIDCTEESNVKCWNTLHRRIKVCYLSYTKLQS